MRFITDKYNPELLDKVIAFFQNTRSTDFIFPDKLRRLMSDLSDDQIEGILIDIAQFDSSIINDLGKNNMYRHQFRRGSYLSEFISRGGFLALHVAKHQEYKKAKEKEQLQLESMSATAEAVSVAAEANRLAHTANTIALKNKKWNKITVIISIGTLLISLVALLKSFGLI